MIHAHVIYASVEVWITSCTISCACYSRHMKNKAAQEMVRRRNKKYGKKWLLANAQKMVDARRKKLSTEK